MPSAISVENLSKYYKLGLIGGGTLREDVSRWSAKLRGKPDPTIPVGTQDHHNRKGGEIWALRDINLEVREGEILGIIGRNGAGKSTLLKILSRITAPTAGRAVIRGRVGSLLEVGTGFHPELTGRENVYLNGAILGMTKADVKGKLEEIIEFSDMGKFIDTPAKRYSSGMTVRLAFAVAAHLEPEILIVDEVLAVGDTAFQKKCLGRMRDVAGEGRTILFVSHNMGSISTLCAKGVVINNGKASSIKDIDETIACYIMENAGLEPKDMSKLPSTGDGRVKGKKIVVNELNGSNGCVMSGDSCVFSVHVETDCQINELGMRIGLYDHLGRRLGILDSNVIDTLFLVKAGKSVITCKVDRLPLYPGSYFLNLSINKGQEIIYGVEECMELVVQGGDYHGAGSMPPYGPFMFDYIWKQV